MTALDRLRRTHTKTLRKLVGWVQRRQRRKQYVPHWQQFAAATALTIINQRKGRKAR